MVGWILHKFAAIFFMSRMQANENEAQECIIQLYCLLNC